MTERHDDNNLWASKLQAVKLPAIDDAWKMMEAMLDNEMPVASRKEGRRWLLLVFLLLLLIGVCNCPGGGRLQRQVRSERPPERLELQPERLKEAMQERAGVRNRIGGDERQEEKVKRSEMIRRVKQQVERNEPGQGLAGGEEMLQTEKAEWDEIQGVGLREEVRKSGSIKQPEQRPGKHDTTIARTRHTDPDKTKERKNDSVEWAKGWLFGLGLNQFYTVGGQERSNYNSGGTTGGLGDYIPIPMVRYYFNIRFFVQMEAQFNAPQFTRGNLLASESTPDPSSPEPEQSSVYIKKLFYFNLPLSVHYSPFRNVYLGAGLQYSRLSNGVGLFENKVVRTGTPDSVKAVKVESFKKDSVYQRLRTNEFRFLVDVDYQYKRFILGLRYNQALNKFINVRISDAQVTQARNSSLQVYLRYILWDPRKKGKLPAK